MQLECKTINDLALVMKNKRIICWGIGNYFQAFIDSCLQYIDIFNLVYLIDNNLEAQNPYRVVGERSIPVISFEEYLCNSQANDLLVITTVHYKEIIAQINMCKAQVSYIPYALVQHERENSKIIIKRNETFQIPAKIHYCWFGHGEIPTKDKEYIEGWKKLCPEYEIICWNEDNFDIEINDYVKYAYGQKKWAFVTDYVRMYILYHEGGIYMDTDVELLKNLDELRYQYAYMGMEESGCVNSGVGMGTVAHNPILGEILELYDSISLAEIKSWSKWKVNADWESNVLRKHGFCANNQYQIVENIAIYPSEFFSPVLVGQEGIEISDNTYSIHHYHYSWLDAKERDSIWNK